MTARRLTLTCCLVLTGCLPGPLTVRPADQSSVPTPRAGKVTREILVDDRPTALRYAAMFDAIADRTTDTADRRIANRIDIRRAAERSAELLRFERGRYPKLGARFAEGVGRKLGPDGDQWGRPLPVTVEERQAAADGLREIARDLRAAKPARPARRATR